MDVSTIDAYFKGNSHKPFYLLVGDKYYQDALNILSSRVTSKLCVSDYCRSSDRKPNLDRLKDDLQNSDVSCKSNKVLVIGLGEYLALEGADYAKDFLHSLVDFNLGFGKAILLLRCVVKQVAPTIKGDNRLKQCGRIYITENTDTSISLQLAEPELAIYDNLGLKSILAVLESGVTNEVCGRTTMQFPNSMISVKRVKDAYDAIAKHINLKEISKEHGTNLLWSKLLSELNDNEFTIGKVFDKHGMRDFHVVHLHEYLIQGEYEAWLCYIYLMLHKKNYEGQYLDLVLSTAKGLDDFKEKLIYSITTIQHISPKFNEYYKERKRLLSNHTEAEMASFVATINSKDTKENVYFLTDLTMIERQAIIMWIGKNGIPNILPDIYPDLAAYMSTYTFGDAGIDSVLAEKLTDYIERYKKQKVINHLEHSFSDNVDELALQRVYNLLPHRDELVKEKRDDSTFLLWIDALGFEYVGYISDFAQNKGLSMSVQLGRANLPTITIRNRLFFDEWPEANKYKIEELDDVKHKEKGGFRYGQSRDVEKYPVYISKELTIIREALEHIAADIGMKKYERVVIASDHGASRLAVLRKKEEKYTTDTQGEHSGRCCKFFDGCDLKFAIKDEDSGYITLADYGRFKGSRAANVEVHGGASLEEVIVPLITLSLKDNSFSVKISTEIITADYKNGIKFKLNLSKFSTKKLTVGFDNQRYLAQQIDDNNYNVEIPTITKAGTYEAEVYLGDNLIERMALHVFSKSATINDDFDDLF